MGTGTAAMGKRGRLSSHRRCRRCGEHTFHVRKKKCSSCGFGASSKLRSYSWKKKGK
jgi:large subunit ribosomal protein L37e